MLAYLINITWLQDVVGHGGIDASLERKQLGQLLCSIRAPATGKCGALNSIAKATASGPLVLASSAPFYDIGAFFSAFCLLFFCNFGARNWVPEMGPKMGPSFGHTIRIVLKPDSEAQFWGTKNGPKNGTQNRAKHRNFFRKCLQKAGPRKP